MLKCRQFTELSSDYLDGHYHGWQRLRIRLHLIICRHCRRFQRHLARSRETGAVIARRLWGRDDEAAERVLRQIPRRRDDHR